MAIAVGSIVEGTVTGITNFGAFIELPDGQVGLVHISEVADTYVRNVNDYLKQNDPVKVKVINIDPRGKIGLSIKQVNSRPAAGRDRFSRVPQVSFEEKLSKFMKESDERLASLKRNTESKRGGRGSGR
ncbi:MAG: S1 RNA-binding domain-containing protein [Firmicutes bacterium]|nr:S1 RNA-binding domain-containing protein [Bacillota bacterium]